MKKLGTIIADDLKIEPLQGGGFRTSMRILTPPSIRRPERFWFSSDSPLAGQPSKEADPFFPSLAYLAWANKCDLEIQGNVSKKLLQGGRKVIETFTVWARRNPDNYEETVIKAQEVERSRTPGISGAMFSSGIDALFTVVRNLRALPPGDPKRIKRLFLVHGFDIPTQNVGLAAIARKNTARFAEQEGLDAVFIRTNARPFAGYPPVNWTSYGHGPCLASILHSFSEGVDTVNIAGSFWPEVKMPWASHPDIDPLWSSESLDVLHDSFDMRRSEKVKYLAESGNVVQYIRSCLVTPGKGGRINCGKCEKCFRTMFALHLQGVLDQATFFPKTILPSEISGMKLNSKAQHIYWVDNLEAARKYNASPEFVKAIENLLDRHRKLA